jgi:hypothetical protein
MDMDVLSLITKVIIICFSIVGLYYTSGLNKKRFKKISFIYFTNLSLVFCLIYFTFSVFIRDNYILNYFLGFVVISVTVTMIINHFILVPHNRKTKNTYKLFSFSDIVVHYVIPLITIGYWIIFAEKGLFEYYYPLLWAIPFLIYLLVVILRAHYGGLLEYGKTRYPYDFIDIDKLGAKKAGKNLLIVSSMIIALEYVFLLVDFILK